MDEYFVALSDKQINLLCCLFEEKCKSITADSFMRTILCSALESQNDDLKKTYDKFINTFNSVYQLVKSERVIFSEETKGLVDELANSIYTIDEKCGINEEITPELSEEETNRIIKLLDADLIDFLKILNIGISKLKNDAVFLNYFINFGHLIYIFNGYPPPRRALLEEAIKDATGETNPYKEYVELLI